MTKPPKSGQNPPEDRDEWESLAEDLFGVEFHKSTTPPSDDDFEDLDDLLEELPLAPRAAEPAEATSPASAADESPDGEPQVAGVSAEAKLRDVPVVDDDTLDSFSFEDDEDEDDESYDADEDEAETAGVGDADECELLVSETKPSIPPDDFWAALDQFTPEELMSHESSQRGKPRGSERTRGPEREKKPTSRGAGSVPVTNVPIIRNEFVENDEFGLGVLEDVEVETDEETQTTGAVGGASDEAGEGAPGKRRRSRRRRRGRRKPKPATETTAGELPSETAHAELAPADDDDDVIFPESEDAALSDRPSAAVLPAERQMESVEDDDEEDDHDDEGESVDGEDRDEQPRYKNVPTWAQAISYLKRRTDSPRSASASSGASKSDKSESPAGGEREKKGSGRRRSRGSGRRRRKPEAPKSSPPAE